MVSYFIISCNCSCTISFLGKILLAKLKNLYIQYAWISIMKKRNSNQNVTVEKYLSTFDYYHHKSNFGNFFQQSCKTEKEVLKLKFRSKFNHGYLQSVVWKALDDFNPIDNGPFFTRLLMDWEAIKAPLAKTCFTYPTMMTLGTVISYPKTIQKIHKSHDAALEFCWHQHFFTENQQILLYQKIQI